MPPPRLTRAETAVRIADPPAAPAAGGQEPLGRFVRETTDAHLMEVVRTGCPAGRLASAFHRGQQQGDEHADDGDDDQQFDQRKAALRRPAHDRLRRMFGKKNLAPNVAPL